jgi:hypothetical protein
MNQECITFERKFNVTHVSPLGTLLTEKQRRRKDKHDNIYTLLSTSEKEEKYFSLLNNSTECHEAEEE